MFFSVHRYEWGRFWPKLRESDYDYIGGAAARGFNINVPFNEVTSSQLYSDKNIIALSFSEL